MRRMWMVGLVWLAACGPKKAPTDPVADGADVPPTVSETLGLGSSTLEELVNDAADLLEEGTQKAAERAEELLEAAMTKDAERVEVHFDLGIARYQLRKYAEAHESFQWVLDARPDSADALLYLGLSKEGMGDRGAASELYRKGASSHPDDMRFRVATISLLRSGGELQEAIRTAKEALRVNSLSLPVYNNLGLTYLDLDELDLAKFVFQKALNGIPGASESAHIQANLGWVYFRRGELAVAEHYLKKAVELDPHLVPALVYLSQIHLGNRNYEDMVPLLETAIERQPENYGVVLNLAIAYRGVGRLEDAEAMYRRALELDPTNLAPKFNLGILLGDHKKEYAQAIASLREYVDEGGERAELAAEYVDGLEKEKKRADRKSKADEERKRRQEAEAERKRLLEEAAVEDSTEPADGGTSTEGEAGEGVSPAGGGAEDEGTAEPSEGSPPQAPPESPAEGGEP